ncbi:MAG: hypothetical protein JKY45_02480 [Emcibacter sp.]|nr:hypothetical protein [Emcibacter sp.]
MNEPYFIIKNISRKVFVLSDFSVFRMYGIFVLIWLTEQVISIGIEELIFGGKFVHWFDIAFTVVLSCVYAMFAAELAIRKENALHPHAKRYLDEKLRDHEQTEGE